MKYLIRILLCFLLLQSFECDKENENELSTAELLAFKKQEILDYIQSFSCTSASSCNYIAFGAKPCGGPRAFLAYPNTVNQTTLEALVLEHYEMDNAYNIQIGASSDCQVVSPPNNVECVNGVCTVLD
ncbi:hypothetical protein [uncultured Flavobacterium sp.]|uniref:hypothetical protein n=1 Tax=uncultured Flavobacterium sp. TaxID=165435 RepID=UPI0030CA4068|tara:strand:- start:2980 stop:3363 length:384 start_codon:yes stop_codon:yes gene_type:complete